MVLPQAFTLRGEVYWERNKYSKIKQKRLLLINSIAGQKVDSPKNEFWLPQAVGNF